MNEKDPKSAINPFVAGAIFGATLTLALTNKEGRKATEKVMAALRDAIDNFEEKHPDLGGIDWPLSKDAPKNTGHNFVSPPKGYPSKSDLESYFDK
jgi:hypothetical protein